MNGGVRESMNEANHEETRVHEVVLELGLQRGWELFCSVRRSVREVVQICRRCSRFTGYVEDKGNSIGAAMGDVSRVRDSAVWMNLMPIRSRRRKLPSRCSKRMEKDKNLLEQPLDEENEIGAAGIVHVPGAEAAKTIEVRAEAHTEEALSEGSGFCYEFWTPFWGSEGGLSFKDDTNSCLKLVHLSSP